MTQSGYGYSVVCNYTIIPPLGAQVLITWLHMDIDKSAGQAIVVSNLNSFGIGYHVATATHRDFC